MVNGFFSHIIESIETLNASSFTVRAAISDNHSVNVNTFTLLKKMYAADLTNIFINNPSIEKRFIYFTTQFISLRILEIIF